jgi:hypothetical protein
LYLGISRFPIRLSCRAGISHRAKHGQGILIAGSGAVGFGTKCCGEPRTIAEIAAKVMMVIASVRIAAT